MTRTADGTELFIRDWPAARPRGTALLIHGLGEHSGRYDHVAAALNDVGVSVRSYDQRGFGRSGGPRATIPHREALIDDARMMFDSLTKEAAAGEPPPFLIGHSMGGAIAARAVTGGWITPRGLVLSSPALRTRLNTVARIGVGALAGLVPNLRVPHGLPLQKVSHDPAVYSAIRADPLSHDRATPRLVDFMIDAGRRARADAGRLSVPTLLLVAGDDSLVDPRGSREFAAAAPPGMVTMKWYDDLWHELFNEIEPHRGRVLTDLQSWISKMIA